MKSIQEFCLSTPYVQTRLACIPSTPLKCESQPCQIKVPCARKLNFDFPQTNKKKNTEKQMTPFVSPSLNYLKITPSTASSIFGLSEQQEPFSPSFDSKFIDFNLQSKEEMGIASFQKSILFSSLEEVETCEKNIESLQIIKSQFKEFSNLSS